MILLSGVLICFLFSLFHFYKLSLISGIVFILLCYQQKIVDITLFSTMSWYYLVIGVIIGVLLFLISFYITVSDFKSEIKFFYAGLFHLKNLDLLYTIGKCGLLTAIYEEWLWRACIQSVLCSYSKVYLGILATAILFLLIHTHRFHHNWIRMFDLFIFALLLGLLFYVSNSFLLIVTIHFLRNGLIIIYRSGRPSPPTL